jgi:ribosomal protein L30E
MSLKNLKNVLKENKLSFGTESTIKNLKKGKVKEVFISKNCPEDIKKRIEYYSNIAGCACSTLDLTNEELGILCKKPFFVNCCFY